MNGVVSPSAAQVLTAFLVVMTATVIITAVAALISAWRRERARTAYRPLPLVTRLRWQPDTETPIGNQPLREYGGPR